MNCLYCVKFTCLCGDVFYGCFTNDRDRARADVRYYRWECKGWVAFNRAVIREAQVVPVSETPYAN